MLAPAFSNQTQLTHTEHADGRRSSFGPKLVWYSLLWTFVLFRVFFGCLLSGKAKRTDTGAFFRLAGGNKEALIILQKVYKLQRRSHERILCHFETLNITGYRIVRLYETSKASMRLFSYASRDLYRLVCLLQRVEAVHSYAHQPIPLKTARGYELRRQVLDLDDPEYLLKHLDWSVLMKTVGFNNCEEEAIHNFLIPDKVGCAQWFVNYSAMKDDRHFQQLKPYLSDYISGRPDKKAPFFPLWFIAGYPCVVQWALASGTKCSLFDILESSFTPDHCELRQIINEYDDAHTGLGQYRYDYHILPRAEVLC